MTEVWRSIPGFESSGQVSNLGRVRSAAGKIRKTFVAPNGYERIGFNGGKRNVTVHRLVAAAFCDGYADGLTVNHKDGNKLNNCADNLEWITQSENRKHGFATGLIKPNKTNMVISDDAFADIVVRVRNGEKQIDIASEYGVTRGAISKRLKDWEGVTNCQR